MEKSLLPLEISNVSYQVNDQFILNNINLEIHKPGITVFMGPNGAGKSILLRLMHGLIRASVGRIKWAGQCVNKQITEQQALVFQKPILLKRSVKDNLKFVLALKAQDRCDEIIIQHLKAVGLDDKLRQPARLLSGGEQQRLAVARALALQPKIILMDEPTTSLDPASIAIIEKTLLKKEQQGVKIFLVTHDIHQARRLAKSVVFMDKGEVLETASATAFFNKPRHVRAAKYLAGELII